MAVPKCPILIAGYEDCCLKKSTMFASSSNRKSSKKSAFSSFPPIIMESFINPTRKRLTQKGWSLFLYRVS